MKVIKMEEFCIVKTAIDNESLAKTIINNLLKMKLISCAQITEINSMYWWYDKIQNHKEYMIEMKTKKILYSQIEKEIVKMHNYSVPEIICIDIINGYDRFLHWIDDETV